VAAVEQPSPESQMLCASAVVAAAEIRAVA
jgi:hypothetical protein